MYDDSPYMHDIKKGTVKIAVHRPYIHKNGIVRHGDKNVVDILLSMM